MASGTPRPKTPQQTIEPAGYGVDGQVLFRVGELDRVDLRVKVDGRVLDADEGNGQDGEDRHLELHLLELRRQRLLGDQGRGGARRAALASLEAHGRRGLVARPRVG